MAKTPSTMIDLGTQMPPFTLPDPSKNIMVGSEEFPNAKGYAIAFICNHCPFVQMLRHEFARYGREFTEKGIAVIAINSNDAQTFPEDAPEKMVDESRRFGYTFPYLFDGTQATAKAFSAACTPDFFLFDAQQKLVYRGQFDGSRPGGDTPVTGEDLRRATEALLAGQAIDSQQKPSLGCNIKWKE